MAKNIILLGIFIFLISSFLVSALKIDIPIASTTNYSTIDVNNSQFLQGYTPSTLATNFLNTYFYPLNSNPAGYYNSTTLPAGGNASFNQTLTDNSYLKLNQATPQTVSGGRPIFNAGLGTPTGNNFIWGDGTLTTATNNIIIGDGSVTMTSGGSNVIIGNGITKNGYTYGEIIIGHGAPSVGSNSASYGSRTLSGPHQFNNGNVIIGHISNTVDPELKFFANSNTGSIKWWEDENYFQFGNFFVADNIKAMFGTSRDASIQFTGTSLDIRSDIVTSTDELKLRGGTNGIDFLIGATEQITLTDGVLAPTTDNDIDLGIGGSKEFKDIHAKTIRAKHYTADDTAPVADGTYTMGLGGTQNGTITVKDGIITAIQEVIA